MHNNMAYIPNKELYVGLSGCVTALACLWANSMRKKNRNTKTRLREELLDLREMIIGPDAGKNVSMPNQRCPPQGANREFGSEPRSQRVQGCNDVKGAESLYRGRNMGAISDLLNIKGVAQEKYIVAPTPDGCVFKPVPCHMNKVEVKKERERMIQQYSPKPGTSGTSNRRTSPKSPTECKSPQNRSQRSQTSCGCPRVDNVCQHTSKCRRS